MRASLLSLAIPLVSVLPAQVPLGELAEMARSRAERARPAQEKALQPFLDDLSLSYKSNHQFLDKRIAEAAELGDSVVPLLLEKLQPAQSGEPARHLASNCRRVLERLDPASFVDALAELLKSRHESTRREAIMLLGRALTNQAERLLVDLVDKSTGETQRLVLRSLQLHKTKAAAFKVAPLLGSTDRTVRSAALDYLTAAKADSVVDTVVQALGIEREDGMLPRFIDYFAQSVKSHEAAAEALVGLLGPRIDWQDKRQLVRALATVAPTNHQITTRRLHELLDEEETSALAVETAVALRALGDRQGVTRLKRTLDDALRRPQRKREPTLYERRANLQFAIGDFDDAASDYTKTIEYTGGVAMTRRAYMGLIRCEANRRRYTQLKNAMKDSGMTSGELEALGHGDPVMTTALSHDRVVSFLRQLKKSEAPK